ncbi:MAG TPA: DegT/DnrJ/EryC1/StrS family aminotransferase [Bryobacteraceae bacterium]|jgi:dTDP-4-amino-4,6-dideoxygalactose transaminase
MSNLTRRTFLAATPAIGLPASPRKRAAATATQERPALLGGPKIRTEPFPSWPVTNRSDEQAILETLRSGEWYRGTGQHVNRFEQAYKQLTGAKNCLAVANGTSALYIALNGIGVEPGDEVVVPPYTFVATVNAVLRQFALPIFVDTDRETFQIDANKIEASISSRTKAILPVHLGGSPCDLDRIRKISEEHHVPLIEDACQAHLAEWRGRKVGTYGKAGCFSFQASKNLNSGEGGAILTDDDNLHERFFTFHNNGSNAKPNRTAFKYEDTGANFRLTEFQAAILMAQMTRIEEQAKTRTANGLYLASQLKEIPGIVPARMYDGCTRNAYHLYMFRYEQEQLAGLPHASFLKALRAEGIPASAGYSPLNKEPFLKAALNSRTYKLLYPKQVLDEWEERTRCPNNDRLCEEAVWLTQTMLLGPRSDMDSIAGAIRKIQVHASELAKT